MQDYHQLEIWSRAMDYAVAVYRFSADLQAEERYNLASQLRRAAASVPLNIAEGASCGSNAEFSRFLGYSYRSVKEVMTCLELCQRLFETLQLQGIRELIDEGDQIARMMYGLRRRLVPQEPKPDN